MANWCENDLRVRGPVDDLNRLLQEAAGDNGVFDFEKFVPCPHTVGPCPSLGPDDEAWYAWRQEKWGTKWNALNAEIEWEGDEDILVTFDTAWSPPRPVVLAASCRFPALGFELRYYEAGCGFHGRFAAQGGLVETDLCGAYFGDRGG